MVGAEDLAQEHPQRHQRGEHPVEPAADRGQRLREDVLGEDVGERQAAVLQERPPEEPDLLADRSGVRIPHRGGLLAGDGTVANLHLRKRGPLADAIWGDGLTEELRAIRRWGRRAQRFGPRETLCPCSLIAANGGPDTMNLPEQCADVSA